MVFFCLNSSIESIYFNKLTVKRAFQKSVLSPILPSYHAQPLNPQTTEWRQKGGALKPSLFWGSWNVDWEPRRIPPLSPQPRTEWVSHHRYGYASRGVRAGLKQPTVRIPSWYTHLCASAACAGKGALVVTPRKSKPILVRYGETTGCLKKALSCIL